MADGNHAVIDKVYYYSIITNIDIHKSFFDLENKYIFPVSISSPSIFNASENDDY